MGGRLVLEPEIKGRIWDGVLRAGGWFCSLHFNSGGFTGGVSV